MSDIKYTSDGRKVAVIGQINSDQYIVQEIFVSEGSEIPSGEKFVTRSLHSEPKESWHEKRLREMESRYEKRRAELDRQLERMYAAQARAGTVAQELIRVEKNGAGSQLETMRRFLSGEITHLFVDEGSRPRIVEFSGDEMFSRDYRGRAGTSEIKLLSLFGSSDGDLSWRLNQYRDGSGGWYRIVPARSYDEALSFAQARFDEIAEAWLAQERPGSLAIDRWSKIEGLRIAPAIHEKQGEIKKSAAQKRIAEHEASIEKLRAEIAEGGAQ